MRAFTLAGAGLAIVGFYTVVAVYSANLPINDDYNAALGFLSRWRMEPSLSLLMERHNEHVIAFTHLVTLAATTLLGEIDFRVLHWFAAFWLLLIFTTIAWRPRVKTAALAILILALWFFRPQDWKLTFYAMASIQSVLGMAFGAGYLFLAMRRGRVAAGSAGVLLWVAFLANTSAVLLAPIAVTLLALRGRWQSALVHTAIAAPPLVWFALTYRAGDPRNFAFAVDNPFLSLKFALGLFGGSLGPSVFRNPIATYLFGGVVAVSTLWYLWLSRDDEDDFAKPLLIYCAGTCAMIALGRTRIYAEGMDGLLSDGRYVVFSLVAVGVLLHRAALHWRPSRVVAPAVAALLALSVSAYVHQIPRNDTTWTLLTSRFDTWATDMSKEYPGFRRAPHHRLLLIEAICGGWFRRDLSPACVGPNARTTR